MTKASGRLIEALRSLYHRRSRRYWIIAIILTIGGTALEGVLDNFDVGLGVDYLIFKRMEDFTPRRMRVKRTAVILITDDEYWHELTARVRRDYLANLIQVLSTAHPALIAIDLDLQSPGTDEPDFAAFREEDTKLFAAIEAAATTCPIILPTKFSKATKVLHPTIFQGHHFTNNVRWGHIKYYHDKRMIPIGLLLNDGTHLDSLAEAVVRAEDKDALIGLGDENGPTLATLIPAPDFQPHGLRSVLQSDPQSLRTLYGCKIVIIGGSWHTDQFQGQDLVDKQSTPVGEMPAAILTANYVEAMLDSRTFQQTDTLWATLLCFVLSGLVAICFALLSNSWARFGGIVGLSLVLTFVVYEVFQDLGQYFDFYIPLALITAHALITKVLEWRDGEHLQPAKDESRSRG